MSLLVLLAILPLLALLLIGTNEERELALGTARSHALDLARLGASRQAAAFEQARGVLETVYGLMQAKSLDRRGCDAAMHAISDRMPQFSSLGIAAADGTVLCHSGRQFASRAVVLDLFARAITGAPASMVIGNIRFDPAAGKPTAMAAMPFYQTASSALPRTGVLFASLDPDRLAQIATDMSDNSRRAVFVIDVRDGRAFAGQPGPVSDRLTRVLESRADGGTVDLDALGGPARIFGFVRLPTFENVAIAVGVSRDAALTQADLRFAIGIALSLLATCLAVAAAWLLADFTQLRPIRALARTALRLGSGDLAARARIERWQAPEFRALAQTQATMAARIALAHLSQSESDRQLRLLADNVTDMIVRLDRLGRRIYVSPSCRTLLGYEPEEMLAMRAVESVHPDDWEALAAIVSPATCGSQQVTRRYRLQRKDGSWLWVEGSSRAVPLGEGHEPEAIVVVRDIDRQVAAERQLKDSEARYRVLAEHATDTVFQLDRRMVRCYVSPACRELVGREPEEMVGSTPIDMAHPEDAERLQGTLQRLLSGEGLRASYIGRIRHCDGHWVWIEAEMRAVRDSASGEVTGIIGRLQDISARKKAEDRLAAANRQLAVLATEDALTGLANRRAFDEALQVLVRRAKRESVPLGLILIDVDRFKSFNDLYGHQAGDECLRAIARAIEAVIRQHYDVAARYGGEELAVIMPNSDGDAALHAAERIRLAIRELGIVHADSGAGIVTISVGVACLSSASPSVDASALLRAADVALYEAKERGRDRVCTAGCASAARYPVAKYAAM